LDVVQYALSMLFTCCYLKILVLHLERSVLSTEYYITTAVNKHKFFISVWLSVTVVVNRPRAGSGAISKWVICACDSLVDFGAV